MSSVTGVCKGSRLIHVCGKNYNLTLNTLHRKNLLAWIRMKFLRISCEFYAWKRDEKQAYEYRTKKTHDIHAIYIWMHANSMRLSYEIICAWYLCVKYGTIDTMPFYTVIAWFSQKNPLFLKNSLGTGPWLVEFFHILFQRRKDSW